MQRTHQCYQSLDLFVDVGAIRAQGVMGVDILVSTFPRVFCILRDNLIEPVSRAWTSKVGPGRFDQAIPQDTKYTREGSNKNINAHNSLCSNRTNIYE